MMELLALTLPYGFSGSFDGLFNEIGGMRDDIYSTLSNFTYMLAFAGLLLCAYKMAAGGDLGSLANQLMLTAVIAVVIHPNIMPNWMLDMDAVIGFSMVEDMNIDLEAISVEYVSEVADWALEEVLIILADLAGAALMGIFSIVGGIVICLFALIGFILLIIVGFMAFWVWICLLLAYLVQAMSVEMGIAVAPLFAGMIMFPTTRETGIRYFMGLLAIMFWPLGWGIGWRMVDLCMDAWMSVIESSVALEAVNGIFGGIIKGMSFYVVGMMFWTVIKKAPPLVNKAITTGTQIGAGLVSAGVASAAGTVSSSLSAAGSTISTATSVAGTAAGAAIGGAASGGAGAGAGAGIGGAIGGAAGTVAGGAFSGAGSGIKSAGEGLGGMSEGA